MQYAYKPYTNINNAKHTNNNKRTQVMTEEEALEELEKALAEGEATQEQLNRAIAELLEVLAKAQAKND